MASSNAINIFDYEISFLCTLDKGQLQVLEYGLWAYLATLPEGTIESYRCFESIVKIEGILALLGERSVA
jgi:hypothetical protein